MPIAIRRVLLLCLLLWFPGVLEAQTNFTSVVVFGDSLSDTGNVAHLVQNANPLRVRFPSDNQALGLNYTDGRFTDGIDTQPPAQAYLGVWVEQLAASFPGKPPVKDALDGGTNYAYGDATTGNGSTTESAGGFSISLHNMGQQVTDYLANVGSKSASAPNAQTLFVLWGGANDLYQAAGANADLNAATATAITNELALVQQLANAGATNFLIPNLPPLGGVPSHATDPNASALNAAAAGFAQGLAQGLATLKANLQAKGVTITVYQPDIFSLFGRFATSPMSVALGNVTDKAQGITGSPDTYLIWDGLHPTTTGHHFAAATAANLFTPLVASSTTLSVPAAVFAGQPATLTATVKSSTTGNTPAGLVTIFNGTTVIGSAALNASGTGTVTFTPATSATSYSLVAVYAGDTSNNISASSVLTGTITAPIGYTPTTTPPSLTIRAGGSGSTVLSAISFNGGSFPPSITLACGTLPAHLSCTFSSTTLTFAASGTTAASPSSTLTIATNIASAALVSPKRFGVWSAPEVVSATLLLPGCASLLFLGLRRRRLGPSALRFGLFGVLLTVGALFGVTGCGSSNNNNAAPGSYTVPVLFTPSTGTAQTVNITVTVQ